MSDASSEPVDPPIVVPPGGPALPYHVVALGASAGGLEALEQFFDRVPSDLGCAFVVIQHLSPEHKSLMAELLARHTRMPVARAGEGVRPEPNHVYLNDASRNLVIEEGCLRLVDRALSAGINLPIDLFFESLARAQGPRSLAIVLSGTGSDGMRGLRAVKRAGGLVFVQDSVSAKFDGMPRSAVATGLADAIVAPGEMPALISRALRGPVGGPLLPDAPRGESTDDRISELMDLVGRATAVDFSRYKRGTVLRRINRRITATGSADLADYLRFVRQSPAELEHLRRDLLISVTRFFRDPEVFQVLLERVLRPLVETTPTHEPIRIWVPGCATGEEAYTIGVLLLEEMARAGRTLTIRILATDIDEAALEVASVGAYGPSIADQVSGERLSRFFEWRNGQYVVTRSLRQLVVVAHHNVASDPPFTRLSLVSCRNLLIYLEPVLQARVLSAFRFGLKTGGSLLLGPSETIGELSDSFRPLDSRLRIFESMGPRPLTADMLSGLSVPRALAGPSPREEVRPRAIDEAMDWLMQAYVPSGAIVTESFRLVHVFGQVAPWLQLAPGEARLNVINMMPRPLGALLTAAVPRALRQNAEAVYTGTTDSDDPAEVRMRVKPLASQVDGNRLVVVTFAPAGRPAAPLAEETVSVPAEAGRDLAELQEELRHSRESEQAMIEELETANEELQATNEELTASNEELHATNEELQAVNEELHTVNAEYARQIQQLEELNNDIDNILRSSDVGTLLLDDQLAVRKFTPAVARYVHLLDRDIGRSIEDLALHFGGEQFLGDVRRTLETAEVSERKAVMPDGRHVLVRLMPYVVAPPAPRGVVVSFIDVTLLVEANARTQKVLDSMPQQVAMLDRTGTIVMVNAAWERFARDNGGGAHFGVGLNYLQVCAQERLPDDSEGHDARVGLERVLGGEADRFVLEYPCHSPSEQRWFLMHCVRVDATGGAVVSHVDITDRKIAELNLRELTMIDPMTGVLNRRGFAEVLAGEADRARRHASPISAILIDCDNFKQVNDRFGHAVGDLALASLSRRLAEVLRPSDRIARAGGDEFLVLLPDTRVVEAALVADRLRVAASSEHVLAEGTAVRLTVSLAVTPVDVDSAGIENILKDARAALAESKARGKNRITLAAAAATETSASRAGDIAALLRATDGIRVAMQPILHLPDGVLMGHELLSRGPAGPLEMPKDLFRRAGEDGLLSALDLRCLRACISAAADLPGWRHANLYPSTLIETPVEQLLRLFPDRAADQTYCIELSEQQLLGAPSALREATGSLRRSGVRIAIDDVGFGRTSLEHLVLIEPEVVKIDRKWVAGIGHDRGRLRTLKRLVEVANALGAMVIAEGIEDAEEVSALLDLGVRYGQGFLLGRPSTRPASLPA